jgi:hypothetical protein
MVLDIPHLVRDLLPGTRSIERMSVACVHTTRPKYLVFAGNCSRPAYVVQFGPVEQMERTHQALMRLHARLPDAVAQSLVCARVGVDECVHIQSGLGGFPWFRVADLCRGRADWLALVHRSLAVLARLQTAVGETAEWNGYVAPGRELRDRLHMSRAMTGAGELPTVGAWADTLDALGHVPAKYQHGDFSVNNLLIGDSDIGIIDFDEFGDTKMPLHDEIGLALSFPLSQHGACPLSLRECVHLCLAPAVAAGPFDIDCIPGLVLHHLLWRIERCEGYPARAGLRIALTGYVRDLLADPDKLLGCQDLRRAAAVV